MRNYDRFYRITEKLIGAHWDQPPSYRTTANTCCQLWLCLGKLWKSPRMVILQHLWVSPPLLPSEKSFSLRPNWTSPGASCDHCSSFSSWSPHHQLKQLFECKVIYLLDHFGSSLLGQLQFLHISLNLGVGASTVGHSIPDVQRGIAIWSAGHTPPVAAQDLVCLMYRESFLSVPIQPGVYLPFSQGFSPAASVWMPGVGPAKCRTSHFIDICNIFCYPCLQVYQGPAWVRLCLSMCQPLLIS